jgi:hypothetical protein
MRGAIFAVVLVFLVFFAGLTISVVVRSGLDILTVTSLVILALLGFGILGALRNAPPDE